MIKDYGYNDFFEQQFIELNKEGRFIIGRVTTDYGNGFKVITDEGLFSSHISGKLRYNETLFPVIGDFVLATRADATSLVIHKVLKRKTAFKRKIAGDEFKEQVQGANFDYIFIVSSMNQELNIRKLERYIITAWDTGAIPVIILTKADLAQDIEATKAEIEAIALGVNIHCVSSLYDINIGELDIYQSPGTTIALFGASGVGKSTLINTLAGEEVLKVNTVREDDDQGRHTTSHRELVKLDNGSLLMDTPGMRELGVWDDGEGISRTFEDIVELETLCKFRNCTHKNEPGCAIINAIQQGILEQKRYDAFIKLKKEASYNQMKAARKLLKAKKSMSKM